MNYRESNEPGTGNYRLDVEDFGPIVKASVDLRPLTVFVGPSNTGKSYLAILLYALHQCLPATAYSPDGRGIVIPRGWSPGPDGPVDNSIMRIFKDWWVSTASIKEPVALPADVEAFIRSELRKARGFGRALTNELRRCFGVDDLDDLIRRADPKNRALIELRIPHEEGPVSMRCDFEFGEKTPRTSAEIPRLRPLLPEELRDIRRLSSWIEEEAFDDDSEEFDAEFILLDELMELLFPSLIRSLPRNAHYLPADRTGVMHSHQVVVSTLIQNATTAGLRPSPAVPMLSGVLADFLNRLIGMSRKRNSVRQRSKVKLAELLENNILRGAVRLNRTETGYPVFVYRPKDWENDIPLMRASSMVSELAPVVLYLRHVVRPGDVLIIEEPEAHLHPAMQAAFARELARLVRSGIRIILTTHSEWFLEQISNLVRLSNLPEDNRAGLNGQEVVLDARDVGAWLFKPSGPSEGSIVEEVTPDPETGLYPTDYDVVSEVLYNESAEIFNRMQESNAR